MMYKLIKIQADLLICFILLCFSFQFSHTDRLVQALERMSSQSEQISMQYQPRCFIDFYDIYKQTVSQFTVILFVFNDVIAFLKNK